MYMHGIVMFYSNVPYMCHEWYMNTVNWEIFVYENIHVLNICVNKLSVVPHQNTLTQKFCQVEITVHVLPVKGLLAMCVHLFIMLQKQLNVVKSVQYVTPFIDKNILCV